MASIDKIYGTKLQWYELHDFLLKAKPEYIQKYMYNQLCLDDIDEITEITIANFSREADLWLMEHCKLDFVQKRLEEQYNDHVKPKNGITTKILKDYMKEHSKLMQNLAKQ